VGWQNQPCCVNEQGEGSQLLKVLVPFSWRTHEKHRLLGQRKYAIWFEIYIYIYMYICRCLYLSLLGLIKKTIFLKGLVFPSPDLDCI
jgi:hypothetical protein